MKLTDPTDDQLNVAFAEQIAGWREIYYEEDEDVDIESRTIYPWSGLAGWPPDGRKRRLIPRFTESSEAVLSWLERHHWRGHSNGMSGSTNGYPHFSIKVVEKPVKERPERFGFEHEGHGFRSDSLGESFAYAATIALLRAHGVEIEFTK